MPATGGACNSAANADSNFDSESEKCKRELSHW